MTWSRILFREFVCHELVGFSMTFCLQLSTLNEVKRTKRAFSVFLLYFTESRGKAGTLNPDLIACEPDLEEAATLVLILCVS